ncbi:MAG TPA: preprotein translocase subunit SecG [Gemmatimonadales bacterium]
MLSTFLLVLLIIDGLLLAVVILLQAGQGGGLASMGGGTTDLVLGGRQAVTILHKTSWVAGAVFMFLALLLSLTASRGASESDVQRQLRQQAPAQQSLPAAPLQTAPGPAPTGAGTTGTTAPVPPAPPPASKP